MIMGWIKWVFSFLTQPDLDRKDLGEFVSKNLTHEDFRKGLALGLTKLQLGTQMQHNYSFKWLKYPSFTFTK